MLIKMDMIDFNHIKMINLLTNIFHNLLVFFY
jgi:hypothetical protein